MALFCRFANFFSVWLRDSGMLVSASERGLSRDHHYVASGNDSVSS